MRVLIIECIPRGRVRSHTTRTRDREVAFRRAMKAHFGPKAVFRKTGPWEWFGDIVEPLGPYACKLLADNVRVDFAP